MKASVDLNCSIENPLMKLFAATIHYAKQVGAIDPPPGHGRFNCRNIGALLVFAFFFTSLTCHLVFDANTFQEYCFYFHPWISTLSVWIGFFINILKVKDLFVVLSTIESIIESRKYFYRASKRV